MGTTKLVLVRDFPHNSFEALNKSAMSNSVTSSSEDRCSFCGLLKQKVDLGAGPSVFICKDCVKLFGDVWNSMVQPS